MFILEGREPQGRENAPDFHNGQLLVLHAILLYIIREVQSFSKAAGFFRLAGYTESHNYKCSYRICVVLSYFGRGIITHVWYVNGYRY